MGGLLSSLINSDSTCRFYFNITINGCPCLSGMIRMALLLSAKARAAEPPEMHRRQLHLHRLPSNTKAKARAAEPLDMLRRQLQPELRNDKSQWVT